MKRCLIGIVCFFAYSYCSLASAEEILDREIQLPKIKTTTYELLKRITDLTGFFFFTIAIS